MTSYPGTWVGRNGSTASQPEGTYWRLTLPASGNLETESSGTITAAPGDYDVTITMRQAVGPGVTGAWTFNAFGGASWLGNKYISDLPAPTSTFTDVKRRITVPAGADRIQIVVSQYNAAANSAIDLQPSVTLVAAAVQEPPPPTSGGTGFYLAGDPLVPLNVSVVTGDPSPPVTPGTVSLAALPTNVDGQVGWNSTAHQQDGMWTTEDGVQYVAYVAADQFYYVTRRTLPSGAWATPVQLTWAGQAVLDGHNNPHIAVDLDGYLHVAVDKHVSAWSYRRSATVVTGANPLPTTWTSVTPPSAATNIGYPTLVRLSSGEIIMLWREGGSGDGNLFRSVYTRATTSWSTPIKVLDGLSTGTSAYPHRIALGADGSLHMFLVWRGTTGVDSNHDFSYAKSLDGGVTWQRSNGTAYTLPLTYGNVEIAVDTAPTGSGMMNSGGAVVDTAGRPHAALMLKDSSGVQQIYHVYLHTDGTWRRHRVTSSTGGTYADGTIGRPQIVRSIDGRLFVVYRLNGTAWLTEVTGNVVGDTVKLWSGAALSFWEPAIDSQAMRTLGDLYMIVHPEGYWSQPNGAYTDLAGYVVRVDLDALPASTPPPASSGSALAQAMVTDGAKHVYYGVNGVQLTDLVSSAHGNVGSSTVTTLADGTTALSFDGSNFASLPVQAFGADMAGGFAVEFVAKTTTTARSCVLGYITSGQSTLMIHWNADLTGSTASAENLRLMVRDTGNRTTRSQLDPAGSIRDGAERHYLWVWESGAAYPRLWVDGVEAVRESQDNGGPTTFGNFGGPLYLGALNDGAGNATVHWTGTVGALALYAAVPADPAALAAAHTTRLPTGYLATYQAIY